MDQKTLMDRGTYKAKMRKAQILGLVLGLVLAILTILIVVLLTR